MAQRERPGSELLHNAGNGHGGHPTPGRHGNRFEARARSHLRLLLPTQWHPPNPPRPLTAFSDISNIRAAPAATMATGGNGPGITVDRSCDTTTRFTLQTC